MRDKRVFGMPVIALGMAVVAIVTIQEGDPPIFTLGHVLFAGLCFVMGFMGLSFALRSTAERKLPPIAKPSMTAAAVTAGAATSGGAGPRADDHLHSTFGTSGDGSETSVGHVSQDTMYGGSSVDCSTDGGSVDSTCDTGGDSGGSDSASGDSGGYDSGGGGGWS